MILAELCKKGWIKRLRLFKQILKKNYINYFSSFKTIFFAQDNVFTVDTKNAGYGGLSLSVEGPSKAEIKCQDNEDGTLDVSYKPTEPGLYIVNLKFADQHVPG